jgi:hypothetical protein
MNPFSLIIYYISWHYTKGVIDYFKTWSNFLWFSHNFFSTIFLFKTLFAPYKRGIKENIQIMDIGRQSIFWMRCVTSRIFGALIRILVLILGALTWLSIFFLGLLGLGAWFLAPLIMFFIFGASVVTIFK